MTSKAIIVFHDSGDDVHDRGEHGYTKSMFVYRNDPADNKNLTTGGATRAYAEFALSKPHRLVGFSSEPDGTGMCQVLLLDEDTAARYEVGQGVNSHFRRIKEIGFGDLVAISSDVDLTPAVHP